MSTKLDSTAPAPQRITSIDVLRGIVIVLMMLDHTRDFVHRDAVLDDPSNLQTTTPLLYLTRWVTHFCAPTFVFLAGISAQLQSIRGRPNSQLAQWLLVRGLFLIALELIVLRPLIWFNFDYSLLAHLQVIWAIGWSMIALAGMIWLLTAIIWFLTTVIGLVRLARMTWLPTAIIGLVGLVLVAGHNFLDPIRVIGPVQNAGDVLWLILHQGGVFRLSDPWCWSQAIDPRGPLVLVHYPLIPWIGLLFLGYAMGGVYRLSAGWRIALLTTSGLIVIASFVILRGWNIYGDPTPWVANPAGTKNLSGWQWNVFSFLNTDKYPPSLLFLCMTIGPALLFLAAFDRHQPGWLAKRFMVFGSVPLFFYILQWPTAHLISRGFQWLAGQPMGWDVRNPFNPDFSFPSDVGFGLGVVYLGWLLGLALLYPLCLWFRNFKRSHPQWRWLSLF